MSNHIEIFQLAEEAFQKEATDLFLQEGRIPRVRVANGIQNISDTPISHEVMDSFWQTCHANPETTHETDTSHTTRSGHRLRVNLYKSMGKLAAVLRPIKSDIPTLEEIGAPSALLTNWASRASGMIIVAGPTGSGKSTTLASTLNWVNQHQAKHIITIEDPIEYLFSNQMGYFSQRELNADTMSLPSALRAALRQSPDIIMLGEIRDEETAKICLQASETGHLVISTLHSSGVTDTLERLINLFPHGEREGLLKLLSRHLIGILSQQLLARPDGGLLLAIEHLENEGAARNWIMESKLPEISDLLQRTNNPSNCSFVRFLVAAAQQGYLDAETARHAAPNLRDFDRLLSGIQ